jgi:D-3-phosphoglycerate dehydrogenase
MCVPNFSRGEENSMIVVTEMLAPPGPALLEASGRPVTLDPTLWRDPVRLHTLLKEAQALIVRNQTRVSAEVLDTAPGLKVVGRLGVGLDNIDLEAARARSITVTAARNANAIAVAEYVLAAMLHIARNFAAADASVRAGEWDRTRFGGTELWGRTLGLVGVGEIGRRVAKRAQAFGMTVIGYDPLVGPYDFAPAEQEIALFPLDEVLAGSDVVSLHVPLLPTTRYLINAQRLAKMRPHAVLINTSRGGIIDERALLDALTNGHLYRAVLDVSEVEPVPMESPLRSSEAVILTPHVAGLTVEAQERTSRLVISDVLRVLNGERAIGAV